MLPLMKTARLWVAALMSVCSFETDNFDIKSSKTLIEFLFSAISPVVFGFDGVSIEGIERKDEEEVRGLK